MFERLLVVTAVPKEPPSLDGSLGMVERLLVVIAVPKEPPSLDGSLGMVESFDEMLETYVVWPQ